MDNTLLTVFVAATALGVLIQAGVLIALFVAVRSASARMEAISTRLETSALPALESARTLLAENREKLNIIVNNLADATTTTRQFVERTGPQLVDALERTISQVNRTLERIDHASDSVHSAVTAPVRRIGGIVSGIAATLGALFMRRPDGRPSQSEDMFI